MRVLSLILLLILLVALQVTDDSPHGSDFELSCSVCHSPEGWELDREIYSFDHNTTKLPLEGQHTTINCRLCHPSLVFSEAGTDCINCHTDMHYQTVGFECDRCHTPESWIVNNITEIHQQGRFPLLGPHLLAECLDCHPSASLLRFEPLSIECIDCHREDYASAANPNHVLGNISTNCIECHLINSFTWAGAGFNHFFFPLTEGHAVSECNSCHTSNDYSSISSDCFSCHQADYNTTSNPNHVSAALPTDCLLCHTTLPGWKPADFSIHDSQYFPIYSGRHQGEWDNCVDCHTNTGNYALFSCIDCHEHNNKTDMDDKHSGEADYLYNSLACLECHPTGEEE
jgi:hypothetical protein